MRIVIPRRFPKTLTNLVALCALLAGVSARAQGSSPVGVHLSWVRGEGAEACPDAAAIETEVAARLGANPFRRAPTQFIEALATRQAESLQVTIAMRGPDGKLIGNRTLTSSSGDCRSVANAAALTIAILIDPDALMRPVTPPPAPPPPTVPPPAVVTGPAGRITILAEVSWGLLPHVAAGIALSTTVNVARRAAVGIVGAFLPERRSMPPNDGFAFGLTYGELVGCFVPLERGLSGVRGELCGGFAAGLLHAVVYTSTPLAPGERWTFAATQLARLVIPLFRSGVLEGGAQLAEPFPRRAFFVEGQPSGMDTVFTQPALAVTGFVGLGLRWR
jgi:hypothetical protein